MNVINSALFVSAVCLFLMSSDVDAVNTEEVEEGLLRIILRSLIEKNAEQKVGSPQTFSTNRSQSTLVPHTCLLTLPITVIGCFRMPKTLVFINWPTRERIWDTFNNRVSMK